MIKKDGLLSLPEGVHGLRAGGGAVGESVGGR